MARVPTAKYRQAAEEIRRHLRSRYKTDPVERAFITWYIEARFGPGAHPIILDGKKDGGIDAIVETPGETYVFQFKYDKALKAGLLRGDEVYSFEQKAQLFRSSDRKADYETWRDRVRPEIRPTYDKVRSLALRDPSAVRFVFITTRRSDFEDTDLYEIEDIRSIGALWYLYSEGFTPPTERIRLTLESHWHTDAGNGGYRTYVGLADVREFLELMKRDSGDRLFAQNVRTNLRSAVNKRIRETYESEPRTFWLCNNGIYIVCKKVTSSGNVHTLRYPSVINGSQTLHAIAESKKRHQCNILVRVLEMDTLGDPKLLSNIVRRTNTQNTMKLANLFAHDIAQLRVALYLHRFTIFYERREREWQNERKPVMSGYHPVNMKDVAQWLSTLYASIGLGTARSQVARLFEEANYDLLFKEFDQSFTSPLYKKLAVLVWCGIFTNNVTRKLPGTLRPRARMARLLLVKLLYTAIWRSSDLRIATPHMLRNHCFGRHSVPSAIIREFSRVIRKLIDLHREAQARDPNIDFSNYFKRDDLTDKAFSAVVTRPSLRKLQGVLEANAQRIR